MRTFPSPNRFTDRLGLAHPIVQAPMAGAATPALAAAVSGAGGLGSLGLGTVTIEAARRQIEAFRGQCDGPLNVNFFCHAAPRHAPAAAMRERLRPWYETRGLGEVPEPAAPYAPFGEAHLALIEALRPEVVSFHFGPPAPDLLDAVKASGAYVVASATTVAEARDLEAAGVDAVIAQGLEAGGHRGTYRGADPATQPGLFALLPQVADAVSVPVVAAGGIMDGRGIAAAFILGAEAVQMGTAFLRCPEAATHPAHRAALAHARDDGTRVTRAFTGAPARALHNALVEDLAPHDAEAAPYPTQLALTAPLREGQGDPGEILSMWAGQAAALGREVPAADLVRNLVAEVGRR